MHTGILGWAKPTSPHEEQDEPLEYKIFLREPLQQRRLLEQSEDQAGAMAALLSGVCAPSHALLVLATILGSEGATGGGSLLATAAQPSLRRPHPNRPFSSTCGPILSVLALQSCVC